MVDDAHGDFVIGRDGRGTPDHLGVAKDIDIYTSSLSKGLGSFGGYVASQNNVIDYCIKQIKVIYLYVCTAVLPSKVHSGKDRIKGQGKAKKKAKEKHYKNYKRPHRDRLEILSNTQIIPIILRDEKRAMDFGDFLLAGGYLFKLYDILRFQRTRQG